MGRYRIDKIGNVFVVLCLFLAAMNFDAKFFYFALGAAIVMLLTRKGIHIDISMLIYLMLSACIGIYSFYYQGLKAAIRCFSYVALYFVGYNFVQEKMYQEPAEKKGYKLLCIVSVGSFVHFLLNYLINVRTDSGRNTLDIWSGEVYNATGQAALACLMIGLAFSWIICPSKRRSRILGILALFGVFLYNLILAGRTVFVIMAIVFVVGFVFLLCNIEKRMLRIRSIVVLTSIITCVILIIALDIGGIKSKILESNFFERFEDAAVSDLFESGRMSRRIYFIKNMLLYPFGGLHLRQEVGYAHDLLLDAYDEYGIFSFLLLIVILVHGIKNVMAFCRNKQVKLSYRMTFLCIYTAILLEFCVEPIFADMPWLFVCFCLSNGALVGINQILEKRKAEQKVFIRASRS